MSFDNYGAGPRRAGRGITGTFELCRLRNTTNGFPNWSVLFTTDRGEVFAGTTMPDAPFACDLCLFDVGKPAVCSYYVTATGAVVFDELRVVES